MRDAEREKQFEEYKDRIGEIVNGIVKRVEFGNVTVDLGRAEAVVRREDLLPHEKYRNGDRVRGYIYDVRREPRGQRIDVVDVPPASGSGHVTLVIICVSKLNVDVARSP